MLGFKYFRAASAVLAGIELMHMVRKGQLSAEHGKDLTCAAEFYALAALVRSRQRALEKLTQIVVLTG
jgi:putative transposase